MSIKDNTSKKLSIASIFNEPNNLRKRPEIDLQELESNQEIDAFEQSLIQELNPNVIQSEDSSREKQSEDRLDFSYEDKIENIAEEEGNRVERLDFSFDDDNNENDKKNKLEIHSEKKLKATLNIDKQDLKDAIRNKQFESDYKVENPGFQNLGDPEQLALKLEDVGYQCLPFVAAQIGLVLNTPVNNVRSVLMEGPSGCGKSFLAKSLSKISGAEFMCLTCYEGMDFKNLIEAPSTLALANAMSGRNNEDANDELMNLGILSRAFLKSQEKPVILLVDEIDKVEVSIDTFFLGPLQDARIWLESRAPIDANTDNLLIIFTKNFERKINDALLRRVHPISMTYLDSTLERKILKPHCLPQIIDNLVNIADTMRYSDASYKFERPPAPEELLKIGRYIMQMLEWDIVDFTFLGRNIWYMISKSENDRFVLELMLRYHPDYFDSLKPNGRLLTKDEVFEKLGRIVVKGVIEDPDESKRKEAYKVERVGLTNIGTPKDLIKKLSDVGYECLPFLATQMCLLQNTPSDRIRSVLLEGPSGCGKSYLAKCLAKVTGAELMNLSCYAGMNTQHLIETPSTMGIANAMSGKKSTTKDQLVNLGVLSRAFLKSQNQPVILLVDEIDKVEVAIDTFFLGPIQDGSIYPESRPPIDANTDNLLIIFTKNFVRVLNDALLRRLHPITMTYLNGDLERKILSKNCQPQLIDNLISIVDRMRSKEGSYGFDRPPAPEELQTIGYYINEMMEYGIKDFATIGTNVWSILAKSEHDRAVLEHMMRFHPDFLDPLMPDGRGMNKKQVTEKLGRVILSGIIEDPEARKREDAWEDMEWS